MRDGDGHRHRSRCGPQKNLIEAAYTQDVLPVYTEDEAGPYQTVPYPGSRKLKPGKSGLLADAEPENGDGARARAAERF